MSRDPFAPPVPADDPPELVDHPAHYQHPSGVECITVAEHHNFNIGSVLKYLWRAGLKEGAPQPQDLRKARWYLNREIARLEVTAHE